MKKTKALIGDAGATFVNAVSTHKSSISQEAEIRSYITSQTSTDQPVVRNQQEKPNKMPLFSSSNSSPAGEFNHCLTSAVAQFGHQLMIELWSFE